MLRPPSQRQPPTRKWKLENGQEKNPTLKLKLEIRNSKLEKGQEKDTFELKESQRPQPEKRRVAAPGARSGLLRLL